MVYFVEFQDREKLLSCPIYGATAEIILLRPATMLTLLLQMIDLFKLPHVVSECVWVHACVFVSVSFTYCTVFPPRPASRPCSPMQLVYSHAPALREHYMIKTPLLFRDDWRTEILADPV